MQRIAPDTATSVVFSVAGQVDPAAALRWRVTDEADFVVVPWTATAYDVSATDGKVTLTIDGTHTGLPVSATRGVRTFDLEAAGDLFSITVLIQPETSLVFGVNTFLTYNRAALMSAEHADSTIPGWVGYAGRTERERALSSAYSRLMQLPLVTVTNSAQDRLTPDPFVNTSRGRVRDMTAEQIAALDPRMIIALEKAQFVEADEILSGDPYRAAAESGMTSLTVGESMQSVRREKPLMRPVSPRAMAYLGRWVDYSVRLGRG